MADDQAALLPCALMSMLVESQSDAILRCLGQSLALNIAIGFSTPQIDQW